MTTHANKCASINNSACTFFLCALPSFSPARRPVPPTRAAIAQRRRREPRRGCWQAMGAVCLWLVFSPGITDSAPSADTLTAGEAVEIALANNYNIRIARNDAGKADNTRKLKVGKLLPSASANASATWTQTEYDTPPSPLSLSASPGTAGGGDWTYAAGGALGWTLFDGLRMFYGYRQVEERARLAEKASRHTIESSVVATLTAYYDLSSTRSLLSAAREQLALSRRQRERAQALYDYGRATKRDLLAQDVLVNADSAAVSARALDHVRARHALNRALGRPPDQVVFAAADTAVDPPGHDAAFWYRKARDHNAGLEMSEISRNIAESQLGIARAALWPVL
ncbi:MAG: hypothetical protein GF418_16835, partial [Chitinivibrionales bacterium]|nr:hypothetical protein [Chitinivibrionales bacterium]MBD3397287.1 hypothetical protein [Chitinivibrionales bacterium]